jgi:hypothetical protein
MITCLSSEPKREKNILSVDVTKAISKEIVTSNISELMKGISA